LVAAFVVWIVVNRRITVEIRTSPPGAKIRINNDDYGTSPVKAKLRKGTYRVDPRRFLDTPHFPEFMDLAKLVFMRDSPTAFCRRLIFTEAEPLRRARFPRDE
jgi:hypothetical protein